MKKSIVLLVGCLALLAGGALSQEVVINDFPIGVGGSTSPDMFKPYFAGLRAISDTLHKYPMARAIVTGGADGENYRGSHDAKNPGLALGRAHLLRNLLINEFQVDSTQILIQSNDVEAKGGRYRYASVRVSTELADLEARLDSVEKRPPVEKHFTEIREVTSDAEEDLGLLVGLGFSSSPFGGIPIVSGAVSWKRMVYVEGIVGHTFWNDTFRFENTDLDTRRRLIGGYLVVYPYDNLPVGVLGGWIRIEEIATDYYEYVKLSEGLILGLRVTPIEYLSLTGSYNPSRQRIAGDRKSESKNDRFLISITVHKAFGGAR